MNFTINDQIHVTPFDPSDKSALIAGLGDKEVYNRLFRVPHPYTEKDADDWFVRLGKITEQQGQPTHFAIRDSGGRLIGGGGFDDFEIGKSHRGEIGYWLARPYWGQGIMTAVLPHVCRHAFDDFELIKVVALVFTHNQASARVLEKCGFVKEGLLRKHFLKKDRYLDAWTYALFSEPEG